MRCKELRDGSFGAWTSGPAQPFPYSKTRCNSIQALTDLEYLSIVWWQETGNCHMDSQKYVLTVGDA